MLLSCSDNATWTKDGILPTGLELSSEGVISGTPRNSETAKFNVTVKSGDLSVSKDFSITINPLEITTTSLPHGKLNEEYSASLSSNGSGLSWSVYSGALPDGLTLNPSSGTISGKPTVSNNFSFTVKAGNSYASASKSFTINIEGAAATIGGSGGGGCNAGLGIFGLAVLAALILKRK